METEKWIVEEDFTIAHHDGGPIATVLSADDFPCVEDHETDALNEEQKRRAHIMAAAPALLAYAACEEAFDKFRNDPSDENWVALNTTMKACGAAPSGSIDKSLAQLRTQAITQARAGGSES